MNKRNFSICWLVLFMSLFYTKAFSYDIAVENAEGITIYYNYINNGLELEVTYLKKIYDENRNTYSGSIVIPEEVTYMNRTRKVTSIGDAAFAGCQDLINLTLPNSVTSIGKNSFYFCAFSNFIIPNGVTCIGKGAFMYCYQMTDVTIPNSVTDIGGGAFYNCSSLTGVHITSIESWCEIQFDMTSTSVGTNPLYYAHHLLLNGEEVKDVVIPNTIIAVNDGVFDGCCELLSVTIPDGVTYIGDYSFRGCEKLTSLTLPDDVSSIGFEAFWQCRKLISINIPENVASIGAHAFGVCETLTSIDIPDNVTEIKASTFYYCKSLTSVTLPKSLITIDTQAFGDCSSLTSIIIPDGVTTIGQFAFQNCTGLTSIKIPKSVTSIDQRAFEGDNLMTIKSMVENPFAIDENVFSQNSYMNATLYVPVGSINKYKETEGWKKFIFFEELMLYKLTYMVDGELYKTFDYEYEEVIMPQEEPIKEGYTFSGWSEIPATMPAHDVTVTGTFSINSYKLTYVIDNEVYKEVMYEYGATITPELQPEGDYLTFEWVGVPETMPAHDVVVTAVYETGIIDILTLQGIKAIYTPNGKKLDKLQKGLNIVVMQDGTVKKVVVK